MIQVGENSGVQLSPAITVGSATGAPGDSVQIPITMENSPEFAGIEATLSYDTAALTLTALTNGSLQNASLNPATGRIVGAAADNYTLNGTICTATFEINAGAAYGEYAIGLTVDDLYDVDENPFEPDVVPGKITVAAAGSLEGGYNVFLDRDKTVDAGEIVNVAVGIAGEGAGYDKYTNYTMTFSYPSDKLTYVGVTGLNTGSEPGNDQVSAIADNSVITVRKYGTEQISSITTGVAFTLQFTAAAAGEASVVCTSAGIGNKGTAAAEDEIEANLLDNTTVITITGATAPTEYAVTIDEGAFADDAEVTGAATAAPGQDYSFTVGDTNYDYSFTVTVDGEPVEVTGPDENGVYTIPGATVTGPVVITLTDMTPKQFDVTVTGEGADDVALTGDEKATYMTDYIFTLNASEGYDYAVAVTVGGQTVSPTVEDNVYTIAGSAITGDVVISVTKTAQQAGTVTVNFEGTGAGKVEGGTVQSATVGKDFIFTVTQDTAHYDYTVSATVPVTDNGDGTYTIAAGDLTDTITVTVTETRNLHLQVLGSEYVKMDGSTAVLMRVTAALLDGEVLVADNTFGGDIGPYAKQMYYTTEAAYKVGFEGNPAGVWLFVETCVGRIQDAIDTYQMVHTNGGRLIKVKAGDLAEVTLDYDYNVNQSQGGVDTNDAQLVWNMYNASYDNAQVFNDEVLLKKFLLADTNQDKVLNVLDSGAIVNQIING